MSYKRAGRLARRAAALICALAIIAPTGARAATIEYTVTASKVNIRKAASTSASIVAVLPEGSRLTLISAEENGWLKVKTSSGEGYLSGEFARLSGVSGSDARGVVTADKLNVRANASSSGKIIAVARQGSEMAVLGLSEGWLQVEYDGKTGYASPDFLRLIPAASPAPSAESTPAPTSAPAAYAPSLLKKGDSGEAVKALQRQLISLGYLSGQADGKFGSKTASAVKAFQKASRLSADGVAGSATLAALTAASATPTPAPLPTPAPTSAPQNDGSLKKGDRGDEVKALQEKLISLGFLSGQADGVFGSRTAEAVKLFQRNKGLDDDGVAGAATLAALSSAASAPSNPSATAAPISASLLKRGASGDEVKALQQKLISLGYLNGKADGQYGASTVDAVKSFQRASGLTVDGMAGTSTLAALASASGSGSSAATLLKYGDTGEEVKKLQTRLQELGYFTGSIGGNYGALTREAVQAFQIAVGLTSDGMAGQSTLAALYSSGAPAATATPAPAPASPSSDNNTPSADTSALAQQIVATAKKYLGCKYIYAHQSPPYFDCSGLTYYVFKQYGYSLLRTAYQQGYNDRYQKLTRSQLRMGDLVFFNTNETDGDLCDHVGIYISDGQFIHASSSAGQVVIGDIDNNYYRAHFSWGRRILE